MRANYFFICLKNATLLRPPTRNFWSVTIAMGKNHTFLEDNHQKYLICENDKKYFMKLWTKFLQTRGVDDDYQGSKISRMKEERRVLCRQWCCALSYLERRTWKARKIRELYPIEWTICRCRRALLRTIDFSNLIKSFFQYYSRKEICYRGYWCLYQ